MFERTLKESVNTSITNKAPNHTKHTISVVVVVVVVVVAAFVVVVILVSTKKFRLFGLPISMTAPHQVVESRSQSDYNHFHPGQ